MKLIMESFKRFLAENVSYSGIVIDENSVNTLISAAQEFGIPEGFIHQTNAGGTLPHHMTIKMGPLWSKKQKKDMSPHYEVGEPIVMTVTHIGVDENAMAARVDLPEGRPTKNKIPHITIAIPEGGKPFLSNKIPEGNWIQISPFEITGIVQEI